MKNQKIRSMKVHEQSGYNYKATPTIILKGQWLKEMGFEIGDYITVSCEDGKLVITPDAEKAAMHLIRKDDHNKLIDKIMAMPGYCFYCHKQIQVEIMRHNIAGAPEWFQSKIESKSICMYDDEMILDELSGVYGEWAISAYAGMLKTACDAYKDGYFEEKFILVSQMDCRSISREDFLKQLQDDCDTIGEGQNLGELKSYVLLQVLNLKFGEQIYVFCSDDKNARSQSLQRLRSWRVIQVKEN